MFNRSVSCTLSTAPAPEQSVVPSTKFTVTEKNAQPYRLNKGVTVVVVVVIIVAET